MPEPGASRRFRADRGDHGRRLDRALMRHLADLPELSRTRLQAWIADGRVRVAGEVVTRAAERLRAGDEVEARLPEVSSARPELAAQEMPLEVLYEDEHLLAVAKPPGLVVHPAYGHPDGTLVNALLWHVGRGDGEAGHVGLVHRLDKDTSGVVLVARSRLAHAELGRAIEARRLEKRYLAVAYGRPPVRKGRIDLRLRRDPADRRRMLASKGEGRESLTLYEDLGGSMPAGGGEALSLLGLRLVTGRTHQLRAHLAAVGLPIVGDAVYGAPRWRGLGEPALAAVCRDFPRQALHAWRLGLEHPATGERLELEARLPADMVALLAAAALEAPPSLDADEP